VNKREQQQLPEYQAQLRLEDRKIRHTECWTHTGLQAAGGGEKGPSMERGFDEVTNPGDFTSL
jgi:hypothetical protein